MFAARMSGVSESAELAHSIPACLRVQLNGIDGWLAVCTEANHSFSSGSVDWGFTTFLLLKEICSPQRGYLLNDTLEVPGSLTQPHAKCQCIGALL